ncbi:hypothetical protein [Pseudolactococcus laudensis]
MQVQNRYSNPTLGCELKSNAAIATMFVFLAQGQGRYSDATLGL